MIFSYHLIVAVFLPFFGWLFYFVNNFADNFADNFANNFLAVQNLKMALKKQTFQNILLNLHDNFADNLPIICR